MLRGALKTVTTVSAAALAFAVSAQIAHAKPDLVIEASDSELEFVGCDKGQPLAKGRIVIRNEGNSDANLRQAEDLFRSFLAVYVPENIDLIDKGRKRTKMEPREQRAIDVELGRGKVKTGRNYNAYPQTTVKKGSSGTTSSSGTKCKKVLSKAQAKKVQQALKDSELYDGSIDGDFGSGSERALRRFQKVKGISPAKGQCDKRTLDAVLDGGSVAAVSSNIKDDQGRTKITVFAVVDPYNLIDESDESNNIVAYEGWLKCD